MVFSFAGSAHAAVRLPHVLSDHMVLQRDAPVHIWGWAEPGEHVRVQLEKNSAETEADRIGKWSVYLPPHAAGGPFSFQVQGSRDAVTVQDILFGDLWIASGQSNMEMPLEGFNGAPIQNSEKEIAAAKYPEIRMAMVPRAGALSPVDDVNTSWAQCTPETARKFSAAAYFFARELHQKEHIPIGLIDTTWGGTPAESWTSMETLSQPNLAPVWSAWANFSRGLADTSAMQAAEKHDAAAAQATGKPAPRAVFHPNPDSWRPASLYNGMIAPFTPLSIRGVIWYQGETNSGLERAPLYAELFSGMIRDWRMHWHQGDFPFLFTQISSYRSTPQEAWGVLRDAQRRSLSVTGTAMAVTLDVGNPDNVHPPDKQTVGHRLALAARALSYGESVHYAGPLFAHADAEGNTIRVGFTDTHANLICKGPECVGFEVAGEDHTFVKAEAEVAGYTVVVKSTDAIRPKYVRSAWPNAPEANLFDSDGLPASTFTSEERVAELLPLGTALTHD